MSKTRNELIIDAMGPLLTAIGLIVTVLLFNREQSAISTREIDNSIRQEILHAKRTQWEKQQDIYVEMAKTVGSISSYLYNKKKYTDSTFSSFYDTFFGVMVMVEDEEVREALNMLHLDIKTLRENKKSVLIREDPIVKVIRSSNFLIETLKKSSSKYRKEISNYQKTLTEVP